MVTEWILVANFSEARILRCEPESPLSALYAFRSAEGTVVKELARHLERAARAGRFDRLSVVGPAKFVGCLKGALGDRALALLEEEVFSDMTGLCLSELQQLLACA